MHLISGIESSIREEIHCFEDQLRRLDEEYWDAVLREALLCQVLEEVELDEADIYELLAHYEFIKSEFKKIERSITYFKKKISNLHAKIDYLLNQGVSAVSGRTSLIEKRGRYMKPRRDYGYNWVNTISHYRVAR